MEPEVWFTEKHTNFTGITFKVNIVLYTGKSKFQRVDVLDTQEYGRVLLLDGLIMFTERDEFVYHEMIAHVPLFSHPHPEHVLLIGGGDGGAVREIVKHKYLRKIDQIELDKEVIRIAKEFFPTLSSGYKDSRVNIHIDDGSKFVKQTNNKYDVVIVDSTDPIGPAECLFEEDFYRNVFNILNDDGFACTQSESPFFDMNWTFAAVKNLKKVFPIVKSYLCFIPTYPGGMWSFTIASKRYDPEDIKDERFKQIKLDLKYYNKEIHKACFALPNFIRSKF
jgi:spermidine synthase